MRRHCRPARLIGTIGKDAEGGIVAAEGARVRQKGGRIRIPVPAGPATESIEIVGLKQRDCAVSDGDRERKDCREEGGRVHVGTMAGRSPCSKFSFIPRSTKPGSDPSR